MAWSTICERVESVEQAEAAGVVYKGEAT